MSKCFYCESKNNLKFQERYKITDKSTQDYSLELLLSETNTICVCTYCKDKFKPWTEVEFCDAMGINPVSVVGKIIKKQMEQKGCCG